MDKKTIRDIDVRGKRVLVRVDYNVPLDPQTGAITADSRLRATLPTLNYLLERKARLILASHLGRPGGKVKPEFSLAPVGQRLAQLLGRQVATTPDCVGPAVERLTAALKEGEVLLLENLRFHPQEEKNDPSFAQALARLGEVFVNEAFSASHRAHASTEGVTHYLPAVGGFQLEKEVDFLTQALEKPERPLAALIGGSKVSDKMAVLENLLGRVDSLLIGGGMACTFLKARGYEVGRSLVEEERLGLAREVMELAKARGLSLLLPVDAVVAPSLEAKAKPRTVPVEQVLRDEVIGDVGPRTVEAFSRELKRCRTVIWNGPVGVYEMPPFAEGTRALVRVLAGLKATTILGGGSTAEVVAEMGLEGKMTFVSTGGGASLEMLEGKVLPGVAALLDVGA